MDPRVLAHFGGDISRANISPRKRAHVLARYAAVGSARTSAEPSGLGRRVGRAASQGSSADAAAAARPLDVAEGSSEGRSDMGAVLLDDEALAWRCPGCGYIYDVVAGEEREGFAAGTAWSEIPDSWCCPDCGVRDKVDFVAVEREPAS